MPLSDEATTKLLLQIGSDVAEVKANVNRLQRHQEVSLDKLHDLTTTSAVIEEKIQDHTTRIRAVEASIGEQRGKWDRVSGVWVALVAVGAALISVLNLLRPLLGK